MKKLKFYGVSDDLFEMDGDISEEISCYNSGAAYHLKAADGEMIVFGHYAPSPIPGATWVIGVTLVEEGIPPPRGRCDLKPQTRTDIRTRNATARRLS
jgi:hypothetical protein